MRFFLCAVGRLRTGPEKALFDHYRKRLTFPLEVIEVEEKRALPADRLAAREAELLLARIPADAVVVALDESGRALDSEAFAARIGDWRDAGVVRLAFLIGGAGGLDESARRRADLTLSLGPMTWPHLLVRGLLAEQLYRAQCILSGHPYHRA